jgi:hypothetical protein
MTHKKTIAEALRQSHPITIAYIEEKARREALLEAARAVCLMCKLNKMKVKIWRGYYRHIDNNGRVTLDCDADPIYQILAADQGESEQEPVG